METLNTSQTALAQLSPKTAKRKFDRLHDKMSKAGDQAKRKDVTKMRQLLLTNPEILPFGWTLHETVRDEIIKETTSSGGSKALMLADVDRCLKELGYNTAPALERIHMDNIATCRLRMAFAEFRQSHAQKSGSATIIQHHDQMLSSAQHRLNKAIEALARVRRLATQAPVFQVNLATLGGQQVNLA